MGIFNKLFGKKEEITESNPSNLEDSRKQLEELKKTVESIKSRAKEIEQEKKEQQNIEKNQYFGDILYSNIEKLRILSKRFETEKEPVILENIKSEMEVWIKHCIEIEENYPNATFKLKGAQEQLQRVKERYNERLYLIVKEALDKYKSKILHPLSEKEKDLETESIFEQVQYTAGFLEKTAENYKDCLDSFEEFHNEVEDLYS